MEITVIMGFGLYAYRSEPVEAALAWNGTAIKKRMDIGSDPCTGWGGGRYPGEAAFCEEY